MLLCFPLQKSFTTLPDQNPQQTITFLSSPPQPAPAPPAPSPSAPLAPPTSGHTDTPNSNVRRVIARRLIESKMGLPHVYQTMDITLDALADVREALKAREYL